MSGGQHLGVTAYIRTRLSKESGEDGHLRQKHQSRYQPHTEGVYHSLRHHRTQGLGERNAIVFREDTATGHFSHTGNHQIGSVRYEDGIDTMRGSGIFTQGFQCQLPSPSAEQVGKDTEHQRNGYPPIVHASRQHLSHPLEIEVPIDPNENEST